MAKVIVLGGYTSAEYGNYIDRVIVALSDETLARIARCQTFLQNNHDLCDEVSFSLAEYEVFATHQHEALTFVAGDPGEERAERLPDDFGLEDYEYPKERLNTGKIVIDQSSWHFRGADDNEAIVISAVVLL